MLRSGGERNYNNNTLWCSRPCFHDSVNNKTTLDATLSEL